MNDPGLDEPQQEAVEDVENRIQSEDQQAEREEREYLDPSRWWFASTAIPLIAGTFGPMANAFSICALTVEWRVYIPPGKTEATGTKLRDPRWLIAVNSVSLAFALIANISLLLNMSRRLSFAVAQPITITGFYMASFLLIALVSVASSEIFRIQPMETHALSQAFYYGILAAAIYFIIACLLSFTAYGAFKGHYAKEFRLTASQRTLMLQTIAFMVYLLLGAVVYSKTEGWDYLDAVFFTNFTLLTIGFGGQWVPVTHTARSFTIPFAIGGLVTVGLVIGSIRTLILEHGKQKMAARFMEVRRQKALASIDNETRTMLIGWLRKIEFSEKGLSENQRREQEFHVMRRLQTLSERKRRYTALAISATAALLLWFIGALIFMYSEEPQGWSYFVSLYYAYISLLTIGYGDFVVESNAGKAFFVFWSQLAVPTLTILISNMGDTVIKGFKDFTIWLGSITVLPDEEGLAKTLKLGWERIKTGRIGHQKAGYRNGSSGTSEQRTQDRLAAYVENEELGRAEEAGEHGDFLERDIRFYHYVLVKEVRELMKDIENSPPKEYDYHEWQYYLRLIGQDEHDPSHHRQPRAHANRDDGEAPDIGAADGGQKHTWSWLGIRSPLMGNQSEPQWLLQRLTGTLESEMRRMSSSDERVRKAQPPISMSELTKKRRSGESSDETKTLNKQVGHTKRRGEKDV
ncbi:voltage-gated potassium channel [Decorospora gaudefroyi]|uniref:Voltage-gated potassium channel n=1 Tax=Decorospora gaudefroyi TaxID=184978 RepID=A0A6A5K6Y6_9PLEO|nr:voltage-gated potassium channel [Decorospora gaudefroyi]